VTVSLCRSVNHGAHPMLGLALRHFWSPSLSSVQRWCFRTLLAQSGHRPSSEGPPYLSVWSNKQGVRTSRWALPLPSLDHPLTQMQSRAVRGAGTLSEEDPPVFGRRAFPGSARSKWVETCVACLELDPCRHLAIMSALGGKRTLRTVKAHGCERLVDAVGRVASL
jgi:hypothetical protein